MTTPRDIVHRLIESRNTRPGPQGKAFSPANIALCKYWGKRDETLNLPVTSSLSISLGTHGSHTVLTPHAFDQVFLNQRLLPADSAFARRAAAFLDLFRPKGMGFRLEASNTIPTAAGFASSASGFAALVKALDDLFQWRLDARAMSILARLGSGSAARSIHSGFVEWHAGEDPDGMDSYAEPFGTRWPGLRIGLLVISRETKAMGSREGMRGTIASSILYRAWPAQVEQDLARIKQAVLSNDFALLGSTAEQNALAMHATMMAGQPPLLYWMPASVEAMRGVWQLRAEGRAVYFTMDAGPNLKLLFEARDEPAVQAAFPDAQIIDPFAAG